MAPRKNSQTTRGRNILGGRIRALRLRLKPSVSQADLAARATLNGVPMDRPTVSRIESGKKFLRDFEIIAIASALRVSVAVLFESR
ncbi:helix-turn-helix domain-containing protein [Oleiharenicola sp. Vm1]|uniref:helix-turn-helix domain-containing protein n=1 Tax=Oleiharenicola sp. Vm1 TaxID=3398393 RepID=UPI0039F5FE11